MRATVTSGQGRLHLADRQPDGGWVGLCGCVLPRVQAVGPFSADRLLGEDPACRYCVAIAEAIRFERARALETLQDTLGEAIQLQHRRRA